ncbi:hypothetical protein SJ05684_b56580 (plasmid) [Sinorhizobium sojae CCBAU 05684]|uniref:Uncharacterized protein n=1 Tax=Sinorhizobium sojae CCBAU 05684 TaxID=716928 RepID=A0A249PL28_9HYPH|nr:hypothetical protein SJ05684_b56580 [Sinorhizobium sojae CCBAU 05684]
MASVWRNFGEAADQVIRPTEVVCVRHGSIADEGLQPAVACR